MKFCVYTYDLWKYIYDIVVPPPVTRPQEDKMWTIV